MVREENLYAAIENYALAMELTNTKIALTMVRDLLGPEAEENVAGSSFSHSLKAAKLLIDLHIMLPLEEEDLLLASMLCHDLLEQVEFPEALQEMVMDNGLDGRVLQVVHLVSRPHGLEEDKKQAYYDNIGSNKLAVLVILADHCNQVEALSRLTISQVNAYCDETRNYLLPLCVQAKQFYGDCHMSVHIMMEKIRNLMDVSDIIAKRYQKREAAYTDEILELMEENARLRRMICQFEAGEYGK